MGSIPSAGSGQFFQFAQGVQIVKLFSFGKDGGPESKVWGFWLIEWKWLFSIALLRFDHGTRDAYHSHAFNSISWLLWGRLQEYDLSAKPDQPMTRTYKPSIWPILTYRSTYHQVGSYGTSWVITFRGPWAKTWQECSESGEQTLTYGRKVVR